MGRLKTLKPVLSTLPPRLGVASGDERGRNRARVLNEPWRRWYRTARWAALRMTVFARDLFTCQMCGRVEGNTSQLVCDHIRPHRGDPQLFWDENNMQTSCKPCHDSLKQQMERGARQ